MFLETFYYIISSSHVQVSVIGNIDSTHACTQLMSYMKLRIHICVSSI